MRFKNIGGIIVIHLGLKEQLFTLLINQNQNQKVSNEFISRRKNHKFVRILLYYMYRLLWCNNAIAEWHSSFYIQNKQWDAIMLAFLMSIAISKVAILL